MSAVYVMAADTGLVKVGWSSAPYARLSQVRKDHAAGVEFSDVRLVGFVKTPSFLEIEAIVHDELRDDWKAGEWFSCDPEQALSVVLEFARLRDHSAEIVRPTARAVA